MVAQRGKVDNPSLIIFGIFGCQVSSNRIHLGAYPRGIAVDGSKHVAYVAVMGSFDVARIDLRTFALSYFRGVGEEDLAERAQRLGEQFRSSIHSLRSPLVKEVRGRGLFNAIVIDESASSRGRTAWQFCLLLKSRGCWPSPPT